MSDAAQPEVIRVGEDGAPVYADWDSPDSLEEVLESASGPPVTKAQKEASDWVESNRARIEARLDELRLSRERLTAIAEMGDSALLAGVERWYSAAETARFFSRTNQWIYDRLANKKFTYKDGTPIEPIMMEGTMRFTLELIREIALSMYRRGTVKGPELTLIMRRINQAEVGEVVFDE